MNSEKKEGQNYEKYTPDDDTVYQDFLKKLEDDKK